MTRLVALVPLWRRHELARIVLSRLHRQGIPVVCVGSEGETSERLARECGADYIEADNSPLGGKFNAGLAHARRAEPDAVLVLGSDNLVTDEYLAALRRLVAAGHDYIGLRDGYVYEHEWDHLVHWPGYIGIREGEPLGSGRCFSRQLLDRLNWELWDDLAERGLDWTTTARMSEVGIRPHLVSMDTQIAHLGVRMLESLSGVPNGDEKTPELVDDLFGPEVRAMPRAERALDSREVTVVIPAFNAPWEEVNRSATSAMVAGATEIVVVDDGSSPPLKPVKHVRNLRLDRNRGISAALNHGISNSTGAWVCWLSAGDTMDRRKIRMQLHHTTGLASFHDYVRESTGETVRPIEDWAGRIYSDNQFSGSTIMVSREVLCTMGGFDESLRWCQDWDMAVRIQSTVGWQYIDKVLGTGSGVPGHSAVSGGRAKQRWADRVKVADRARALEGMSSEDRAFHACL